MGSVWRDTGELALSSLCAPHPCLFSSRSSAVDHPTEKGLVISMCPQEDYSQIIEQYPPVITKEQLYKICRVSKKTAQYYLESGLIPCRCSGKKTRKYRINTADVVSFLIQRDSLPDSCRASRGWYAAKRHSHIPYTPAQCEALQAALERILLNYPDVLSCADIAEIVGCGKGTVANWCHEDKVRHFLIRQKYHIPQSCFLEYLSAGNYCAVSPRSYRHILRMTEALA